MVQRFVRLLKLTSFCVLVCLPLFVSAFTAPGNPSGYVNDFANVLSLEQKNILEQKLSAFNASTTNEITVVTIQSLGGDYIEHYAVELFKAWGIGASKRDNGVLLLVAVNDHKMRIEVGYGLEGALTDAIASQIIRNDLTPLFKQNDFYGGISRATDSIIKVTQGEYVSDGKDSSGFRPSLEGVVVFLLIISQFFGSILARSKSWWAGGLLGAAVGIVITSVGFLGVSLLVGGIITVALTLLGLLFDYFVSNAYTQSVRSGSSVPWWAGGGRGGSSGGSSFGGFGGGRSGGGGSSGSW